MSQHSWSKERHCEDILTGLFLKRKGWFCSFSCKCCSCIAVITILEFKVTLLDEAVFHDSFSVLSVRFYWTTRLNLTVIKLNGQHNSVWNKQVNTTCLCSEGTVQNKDKCSLDSKVNFGIIILILYFFTTVPPVVFPLWHYTSFPNKSNI